MCWAASGRACIALPNCWPNWAGLIWNGCEAAPPGVVTVEAIPGVLMTWPLMVISPVTPPCSANRATVVAPSTATLTPPAVPRMPMVATGVLMLKASGPVLAIEPETKVTAPVMTDINAEPLWADGS